MAVATTEILPEGITDLRVRAQDCLARAAELIELCEPGADFATLGADDLGQRLHGAMEQIVLELRAAGRGRGTSRAAMLCELVLELQGLAEHLRQELLRRRVDSVHAVQAALGRLRGMSSVADLLARATAEVCDACGFDRAILFRVDGSEMVAESVHFGDPEESARVLAFCRENRPELTHMLLETEMVRRRRPVLVRDAQDDPRTHKLIVKEVDTQSYVAAPIMPRGKVIGFMHADYRTSGRDVDECDRDLLWAFAEGFGFAVERTVLVERLRAQRTELRRLISSSAAVLDEFCDAEVELVRVDSDSAAIVQTAATMFVAPESRLHSLLTRREIEVLELLATGATNGEIAGQLVISEGTVKSHVKHLLRKLRASNRAEAVSRYHRLSAGAPG